MKHIAPILVSGMLGVIFGMFLQSVRTDTQTTSYDANAAYADSDSSPKEDNPPAPYEVPSDQPTPAIALEVNKDHKAGYNLFLNVTHHTFTPKDASHGQKPGEGHAHLYIDGQKITRLYGDAYYLGDSLTKGEHVIQVILSTNNHRELQKNGQPIKATAIIKVE